MEHKPYHHGDLRNSLIEAGIELINTEGEKQFSLRKVSKLCGVSQAAPYSHFKDKEDLLRAMQEHVTNKFVKSLEEVTHLYPNKNDERAICEMGIRYVMFFINNPQYFHFLFSQPCMEINISIGENEIDSYPPFEILKRTVFNVFKESGMSKEKMEEKIISLWATVHGLASIATMKGVNYNKDWETTIKNIIRN
ncbi:TetR/AcrR family transcriptional regulator [Clostridium sp. 19966]|uniref:TetR/AcrR family transcriptional regulator n=1 Tax=Clostridium sp. 19966 TaxID=2768166 RepID=UPI0028DF46EB|nr:TetR/AcrR family transcriptional regulator [Clostridium sp. 19966]MDT8719732.1 TetR/AcrR family transcriptional regulator [Clostridium sp. 19966]